MDHHYKGIRIGPILKFLFLSNQSGGEKKSTRAQVESLAKDRGLKMDFVFVKPPGFVYRIG